MRVERHAEGIQIEKPEYGTARSANRMTDSTCEGMGWN